MRLAGRSLGVVRIDASADAILLQFEDQPSVDPGRIIQLVQKNRNWKLAGPNRLRIEAKTATLAERVIAYRKIVADLAVPVKPGQGART